MKRLEERTLVVKFLVSFTRVSVTRKYEGLNFVYSEEHFGVFRDNF